MKLKQWVTTYGNIIDRNLELHKTEDGYQIVETYFDGDTRNGVYYDGDTRYKPIKTFQTQFGVRSFILTKIRFIHLQVLDILNSE